MVRSGTDAACSCLGEAGQSAAIATVRDISAWLYLETPCIRQAAARFGSYMFNRHVAFLCRWDMSHHAWWDGIAFPDAIITYPPDLATSHPTLSFKRQESTGGLEVRCLGCHAVRSRL